MSRIGGNARSLDNGLFWGLGFGGFVFWLWAFWGFRFWTLGILGLWVLGFQGFGVLGVGGFEVWRGFRVSAFRLLFFLG